MNSKTTFRLLYKFNFITPLLEEAFEDNREDVPGYL